MSAAAPGAGGAKANGGWRVQPIAAAPGTPRPDAYLDWLETTGYAYYGPAVQWLPVLIELNGITAQQFAAMVQKLQALPGPQQDYAAGLRLPAFYSQPARRLAGSTPFIGLLMHRPLLQAVRDGTNKTLGKLIRRVEISRAMAVCGPPVGPPPSLPPAGPNPPQVVVAVIDDGIAFAQERLLDSAGHTRVAYLWDQQVPFGTNIGPFGRELVKHGPQGLDALMAQATHNGQVDEDALYRLSGFVDRSQGGHQPLGARHSHGAHVADLACFDGQAPLPGQRPVIAVQLPPLTVQDTSGATLRLQAYLAILYAIWRADTIAEANGLDALPLVISLSYGLIAGPHDGSDLFEQAVDTLLASCPPKFGRVELLLPSGNSHLSRCHALLRLPADQARTLRWRVLPDDRTESGVQIRLPPGAGQVTLSVRAPDGSASPAIGSGFQGALSIGTAWVAQLHYPAVASTQSALVSLQIGPTASVDAAVPVVPAGLWTLTLHNAHPPTHAVDDVHAWVQRDDTAPGYVPRGHQSFFDDRAYARFDHGGRAIDSDTHRLTARSHVRREGTHNALATGGQPVVVAAFRRQDGGAAAYSAGGLLPAPPPRGAPSPHGPDAMLPGDDTAWHRGLLGAGTRSGSCVAMSGTSVAAPQAARILARLFAGGPMPAGSGRQLLYQRATNAEITTPPKPKPKPKRRRGGGGRLDEPVHRRPRYEP